MHPYPFQRSARARSYTLIELIIVMAVLALAAAVLVPNIVGRDTMTAQAAVRLLISDLSFAQSDALAVQGFRRVVFFDDGTGYCIIEVDHFSDITPMVINVTTVDYVTDPLGSLGLFIRDYTTDSRFEGVQIIEATIDSVALAPGTRVEITYDELGGSVMPGGLPGLGGSVTINYEAATYRVDIAPFTGKLTVTKL
jgi:prepilin-type N-terminal cleavage/methylation domain-containing protein